MTCCCNDSFQIFPLVGVPPIPASEPTAVSFVKYSFGRSKLCSCNQVGLIPCGGLFPLHVGSVVDYGELPAKGRHDVESV